MELDEPDHRGAAASIPGQGSSNAAVLSAKEKVVEIEVHGLKARVFLNCSEEDLIPSRYLKKAERSRMYMYTPFPWGFFSTYPLSSRPERWNRKPNKRETRVRAVLTIASRGTTHDLALPSPTECAPGQSEPVVEGRHSFSRGV